MINHRLKSFKFAYQGLIVFFTKDPNALIHLFAAVLVIALGFWLEINRTEWCLVVFAIGFVIVSEAFNTTIEYLVNLVSPGYNELAGKIKDLAAAAVLLASITAAIIGLIIFLPKLSALL